MEQDAHMLDTGEAFASYLKRRVVATNTPEMQRLSVVLYRLLGRGAPVTRDELARACDLPRDRVEPIFREFRPSALVFGDRGAINAYGGLSLVPTRHRFLLGDTTLYTWCAFDALFLPEILGKPAVLVTHCPGSDAELTVELVPGGVCAARPSDCVMSIVMPDSKACCDNLRGAFCDHVNLFRNEATFRAWAARRAGIGCVPLQEAQAFARQRNALRYPDIDLTE